MDHKTYRRQSNQYNFCPIPLQTDSIFLLACLNLLKDVHHLVYILVCRVAKFFFSIISRGMYCIRQNFRWLKFLPKTHTLYWDKNFAKFNFANHASYLPGSSGWSSRAIGVYVHMCVYSRLCVKIQWVKIFTVQKN